MVCYNCREEINKNNQSAEHIINWSIGGHWALRTLLCRSCNSTYGFGIDKHLDDQLSIYGFLLDIDLQGGEKYSGWRELRTQNGESRKFGPGMVPYDQIRILSNEGKIGQFDVAPSDFYKQMQRKKREMEKNGPVIDKEYISPPALEPYYIAFDDCTLPDEFSFGGKECIRSIAKMCLNYYVACSFPVEFCADVLSFVKGESDSVWPSYYYPTNEIIHHLAPEEVSHIIHLRGSQEQGTLYAYIELFNWVRMIVPFSFRYEGKNICSTYAWDLINAVNLPKDINLRLHKHHLEILPDMSEDMSARMGPLRNRLLRIIQDRAARRDNKLA